MSQDEIAGIVDNVVYYMMFKMKEVSQVSVVKEGEIFVFVPAPAPEVAISSPV